MRGYMHRDVNTIPTEIRNGVTIIAVRAARRVNINRQTLRAECFTIEHAIIRIIYNACSEILTVNI